jgi:hypothetical protein
MATIEAMEEVVLGCCGVVVWFPKTFLKDRRETGKEFYCPNGHARSYHETTAQKLQRQLDASRKESEQRLEKLVGVKNGKCPFCWKQVKELSAHIERKH